MFDQNDQSQQTQNPVVAPEPATDTSAPALTSTPELTTPDPITTTAPSVDPLQSTPTDTPSSFNMSVLDAATPADPVTTAPAPDPITPEPTVTDTPSVVTPSIDAPANDDLLSIKQEALQNLSPLLNQLEQTPEEKFRTTMMLIQASDNQSLIQSAYSSAKEIEDEKVRAQALLDIVNEINYFTQHKAAPTDTPTV